MRVPTVLSATILLSVIAISCTSVKRFKSASYRGEDNTLVDLHLFGSRLESTGQESAGKSLWDLSASAQPQLIQILNERYPDNAEFTGALKQEFIQKGAGPVSDYTSSKLRMVFHITRLNDPSWLGGGPGHYSPADRIESLKISLEIPPEARLRFTGWNHYSTEYGDLEIADMSFSRSLELDAATSGERSEVGVKGSANRSEKQVVTSRYLVFSGSISDHRIEIFEEGTRGADLAGNLSADVSLQFESFPERVTIPHYSGESRDGVSKVSALNFMDVMVPRMEDAPEAISATLELEYIYRHVESGWKTFQEWDDRVAYYKGSVTREVILFEKHEYAPPIYCIADVSGDERLRIWSGTGIQYPLQFNSEAEANQFLEWLIHESMEENSHSHSNIEIGDYRLMCGSQALTFDSLRNRLRLEVMHVY